MVNIQNIKGTHIEIKDGPQKLFMTSISPQMSEIEKREQTAPKLTCNIDFCKYDIVRECLLNSGFKITESSKYNLMWIDTGVSVDRLLDMQKYQKINHFPMMQEICRKDRLARNLNRMSRSFPKTFAYVPRTWIMPADYNDLLIYMKTHKSASFIAKPDNGCQGKGIFLFQNQSDIPNRGADLVVQKYLSCPFLINNYKFDFRVYVLVTSVEPLRIMIYRDGLARFATSKYEAPLNTNIKDMRMHLTNYAINKDSDNFVREGSMGSKRTISSVLDEIEKIKGVDKNLIWAKISDIVIKTILVVQPQLSRNIDNWFPKEDSPMRGIGSQCFEILGFDVMLDSKLKPWVLEVNHSPSFACESELDTEIKSQVIGDALRLLNLSSLIEMKNNKKEKRRSQSRLWGNDFYNNLPDDDSSEDAITIPSINVKSKTSSTNVLIDYKQKFNQENMRRLKQYEDNNMGNYQRVFPPDDETKLKQYLVLLAGASNLSSETKATKGRLEYNQNKIDIAALQSVKKEPSARGRCKVDSRIRIFTDANSKLTKFSSSGYKRNIGLEPAPCLRLERLKPLMRSPFSISIQNLGSQLDVPEVNFSPFVDRGRLKALDSIISAVHKRNSGRR